MLFFFSFLNDNLRRELSGILLAIAFKPMLLNGYATRQSSRSYPLTPFLPGLMDPRNIIRCFDVVRMFLFLFFFVFQRIHMYNIPGQVPEPFGSIRLLR